VVELLQKTNTDSLIAQAGALPFELVSEACSAIKLVIWFVEHTSRHMDWTEVPEDVGGKIEVDAWHELVQNHQDTTSTNPPELKTEELGKVITVWQGRIDDSEIVEFTQKVSLKLTSYFRANNIIRTSWQQYPLLQLPYHLSIASTLLIFSSPPILSLTRMHSASRWLPSFLELL
jgi:hypothetical protein